MLPIQKMFIKYNFSARGSNKIEYIIIHNTANANVGAGALANRNYFDGGDRQASADFFVDDKNIIQTIDYHVNYSWAVGDGHGAYGIWNYNSVSIEICENSDMDYNVAVQNALELAIYLMKELGLGADRVVRHYDASRKNCPHKFNNNGDWSAWNEFKSKLTAPAPQPASTPMQQPSESIYRVRKDWTDVQSQIGAYRNLDSAKALADANLCLPPINATNILEAKMPKLLS